MYEIFDYQTEDGHDPYKEWLADLADRQARARVSVRVQRMAAGNFGDHKPLTDGVWELKIDHGPGYRVYYAQTGRRVVMLLVGGDKRRQQTDIETAVRYWQDWQRRNAS
jgi:putative addiction module killer protein